MKVGLKKIRLKKNFARFDEFFGRSFQVKVLKALKKAFYDENLRELRK